MAEELYARGDRGKALEVLDRCIATVPERTIPYNISWLRSVNEYAMLRIVDLYFRCGAKETALAVADRFLTESTQAICYFAQDFRGEALSNKTVEDNFNYLSYLIQTVEDAGCSEEAAAFQERLYAALRVK